MEWPDVSDPKIRKCPRHNAWIQNANVVTSETRGQRYCPRCDLERLQEERKKGPANPVKVRIMKL